MSQAVDRTFCFVDLAGFTALTETHGDRTAVALLDQFLAMARVSLGPHDQLVKSIGDAVMLASLTPQDALTATLELLRRCRESNEFPLARAGAHHGSAISRGGDYLGGAVNLAARVAGRAGGGQFLATTVVAEAAREMLVGVMALGRQQLHNVIEPVDLFEILCDTGSSARTVDPVCRMRLDSERATGRLRHEGREFWFCSIECTQAFAADPTRYVASAPSAD